MHKKEIYTKIIKRYFPAIHEDDLIKLLEHHTLVINFTSYYICNYLWKDALLRLEGDLRTKYDLRYPLQWNCYEDEFFIGLDPVDADNSEIAFYIKDNIHKYITLDLTCWGFNHFSNHIYFKSEPLGSFYKSIKEILCNEIKQLPYDKLFKLEFIDEIL